MSNLNVQMEKEDLKRDLKNRHIQLIAIGGVIGVALFMGSASTVKLAGPSTIFAYILGGILMYFVMRALGEIAVEFPVSASFSGYAKAFIGSKASFMTGWTYWFQWVTLAMCEISAVGMFFKYWYPDAQQWIFAICVLVIMTAVNLIAVKLYGELEFWFAGIKVVAIIFMLFTGGAMILFGIGNNGEAVGFSNLWTHNGMFPYGVKGMCMALVMVIFGYAGIEMVGVTAGEAQDAAATLKSAINKVFWRILIFYVFSILVILSIYPWDTLRKGVSPFVLLFEKIGIPYSASIMNAVIITSASSCLNTCVYTSGRMLYSLSLRNEAPKYLAKISGNGVPLNGILTSCVFILIGVFLNWYSPDEVFYYMSSATATSCIWAWGIIILNQYNFRKKLSPEQVASLKFPMPLYPWANYFSIAFLAAVVYGMVFDHDNLIGLYTGIVWYIFLFACFYIFGIKQRQAAADQTIKTDF
jgi:amino acid transporter, AAT family